VTDGPWLDEAEQRAWRSYLLMRRRLETHLSRHLQREFGVSKADFEILVNLSESAVGRMRAYELGEATQWEKSRLSHQLRRMEERGLIRKAAGDGRYPEIVLTEQGRDTIVRCAPKNAARVRSLFVEAIGPERLAVLTAAYDDVVAAIDARERADPAGPDDADPPA
jgi:DNA-binding MarR family transcriptional regulator